MPHPNIPGTYAAPGASKRTKKRRAYATLIDLRDDVERGSPVSGDPGHGDRGRARFPMANTAQARNALSRLPQAMGLSADDKRLIAQRAVNILGYVTGSARKWGVHRVTRGPQAALMQHPRVLPRRHTRL